MKKLLLSLPVLCLVCFFAISASASGIVEGDMGTLNIVWNDTLDLTAPGQTTYNVEGETYVMALSVSSKLNGETLYISARNGVDIMINATTQHPVDGWYVLPVSNLSLAIVNRNAEPVTLTMKIPAPQPELFDIDVARMILGNALEFQFGVAKTKIPDTTGYYAVIEKTWADRATTTKIIPAEEWGVAGQYWAIVYDGLAAKEMADTFYVTIYNEKGQAVSNAKEDSVRAYVERAYASQKATGKTMMVDMLNYGAAAQVHFGYGTSDLANSWLTDAQKAVGTAETPEMSNDVVKGTNYSGSRFILTSRIQVQLAFKNLTADMYAIYTYTSAKGEAKTVRVEGSNFVIIGGKPTGVELSQLVYSDARTLVDIVVYNADGTVHATASDSIESACARSSGDVFTALMKFADSAKTYLY